MPRGVNSTQTFCNTVAEYTEELVECPYNIAHQLRPDRLVRHLVICRRECLSSPSSPGYKRALSIKICPYNSTHHIQRADLEHHLTLCKSALLFKQEKEMLEEGKYVGNKSEVDLDEATGVSTAKAESDEEDWDKEMEGLNLGTYCPMEKVVKENMLFNAQGRNKSTRRDIRSMQRLGDKEGLAQALNGSEEGSYPGEGHIPVGMSQDVLVKKKKKKNKKK